MSDNTGERDPVDLLAEEFSARLRAGETPAIDEFVHRCPERDASMRALFASIAMVERLSSREYDERRGDRQRQRMAAAPVPTFGDFRIVREVGRGGMGIVYEAVQSSLNRRVALKLLAPQVAASRTQLERFRREAEAAARLHHTNIVPIYGLGEEQGTHFYAMQFIDGAALHEVIDSVSHLSRPGQPRAHAEATTVHSVSPPSVFPSEVYHPDAAALSLLRGLGPRRRAPSDAVPVPGGERTAPRSARSEAFHGDGSTALPDVAGEVDTTLAATLLTSTADSPGIGDRYWQAVARLVADIADALGYAHRHGVLHRDIKPSNLLLDCDGVIWVADFGLAKNKDQQAITRTGDIVGTLRYMAPEQLHGEADARSDIYSLGLTLFELLALRPAFDDSRHGPLIKSKTGEAPPRLRTIHPAIPADLETITLKCCATEPAHRYQSAGELADDLNRFLEGRPIQARRVTAPERLWRWCRRNPALAALCSAIFLLLVMVALVFAVGNHRTRIALANLEREHARAETNLALAIRAFEQVIENISSRGVVQPADLNLEGGEIVAPESVLTVADAELLETLLAFFDRFANENGTDLKVESASARKRVGDIQQRLGRFVEAEANYRAALDAYTALSQEQAEHEKWVLARAAILNELGVTASRRGAFMLAMEKHLEARRLLEQSQPALLANAGKFELARTLLLLCSIASRNGVDSLGESLWPGPPPGLWPEPGPWPAPRPGPEPGPGTDRAFTQSRGRPRRDGFLFPGERRAEWKEDIERASALLAGLLAEQLDNQEYRLFLARSCREQARIARLGRDRARAEELLNTAVAHLDRLVTDFPAHPGYKAALAELLCTRLSLPGEPESDAGTVRRVERAAALGEELVKAYPHIPEYRFLNGSALNRLGSLHQALGHPEQARDAYLRAIAYQETLTRQFPSVLHNVVALAESLQRLADLEVALHQGEAAVNHLDTAIAHLEKFPKRDAARFLPPLIRRLRERRIAIGSS